MIKVKIKNFEFNSPIIAASGTFGYGDEVDKFVDLSKLGCVITKSITLEPREGNLSPRIYESKSGMINAIGLANVGVDKFCSEKLPLLNNINTNFIVSIAGSKLQDYIDVMNKIELSTGKHIGYEINISCPNVKEGGMAFGVSNEMTEKLTSKMRKLTNRLLIMKLSPNVTCIEDIAKAAEAGGADAVSAINTVVGMAIDVKSRMPKLFTNYGGLSGPAIKPISIANVNKVYKAVNIPVIGFGGVWTWDHLVDGVTLGKLDGLGVGNVFHFKEHSTKQARKYCPSSSC